MTPVQALRAVGRFLIELKRRKVYQVAAVYLAAAFVGLEALDLLVPETTLPGWAPQLFIALAVLGFPIALVLAWAFDLTPDGVRRAGAADIDVAGAVHPAPDPPRGPVRTPHERSIAVLPFETLGAEKATAFTDAVHGDVLTRLSSVSELHVISRTSVLSYRRTEKPLPAIASELNVRWVLGGEVQEIAGQVQVHARLVDAGEDRQVWAERYRRQLTAENLFDIQSEITKRITGSLEARLTSRERREVERAPTGDLEAYRRYAQGRGMLDQRTEDGMRRAAEYFRRAIEQDPDYALAWMGLGDALTLLQDYGHEDPETVLPEAESAIDRALALEPTLAEAHASLGLLHTTRRNGPGARRELERAIALRPGYAEAYNWLAWLSVLIGDRQTLLDSATRAVELDPLSPEALTNLTWAHLANGDAEAALRTVHRERALQSAWSSGPFCEAIVLYHLRRYDEAKAILEDLESGWAPSASPATLALAHIGAGEIERGREVLTALEGAEHRFAAGLVHAALGHEERALEYFMTVDDWAYWPSMAVHHYYPDVLGPLRVDPRWQDVVRSVDRSWKLDPGRHRGDPHS